MSNRDWLSLTEIARLWSAECGESAADLERDLEAWFTEFVARTPAQQPVSSGRNGDTTNRLMGMLGARYLERQTFEAYCEERGHAKPRFWFSGRIEEPRRDTTRPSGAATREAKAAPPQSADEPPSAGPGRDPDLESFQTQIASMSERLKAPSFDYSSLGDASEASQTGSASQPGQAEPSMDQSQLELIERAEAATAKARQLKIQLEVAERQITNLTGSAGPGRAPATAQPHGSDPAPREAPRPEPSTSIPSERRASAGYRDPSVTSRLLQQGARRKGRGRTILVAGLAIPAAALVLWGGLAVIQLAGNEPIPPPSPVTSAEQFQAEMVSQSFAPLADQLGTGGEDIRQPDAPWSASSSKPTTAELTAARQRLETALQTATAEAGPSREKLILAVEIARAQAALFKQDLDAALERLARTKSEARTANARADILAKELIDTRHRHSAAVEIADADDNSARRQLAREALVASDRAVALEQDLSVTRRRVAELKAQLGTARSETASLAQQLAQLRKEHAALLEIFRAQAYQGSR